MARRPVSVTQADITRTLRAARKAGLTVSRFEVDPKTGRIVILSSEPQSLMPSAGAGSALDAWREAKANGSR